MDAKQIADRAQFRRYAEAAVCGVCLGRSRLESDSGAAVRVFDLATAMMLAEGQAFERYEILALEAITSEERARHEQGS
jgi:hypothetical protein